MLAATERFGSRVYNYIRYRPSYPSSILMYLQQNMGLNPHQQIADLGSGTGILSELFLKNGNVVYGVEPNRAMREAAEQLLTNYSNFISIDGCAEATTLADHSVDWVVAGQAFHWFDSQATKLECIRIRRSNESCIALIWNLRARTQGSFMDDYERIIEKYGTDYAEVHMNPSESFFDKYFSEYTTFKTPHYQVFDWNELLGRALSSSYVPQEGHPMHELMIEALKHAFDKHQHNQIVRFDYETVVYCGQFA